MPKIIFRYLFYTIGSVIIQSPLYHFIFICLNASNLVVGDNEITHGWIKYLHQSVGIIIRILLLQPPGNVTHIQTPALCSASYEPLPIGL